MIECDPVFRKQQWPPHVYACERDRVHARLQLYGMEGGRQGILGGCESRWKGKKEGGKLGKTSKKTELKP